MKTKKLFFIALTLYFIGNTAFAQTGKGINVLSGSIYYSTNNSSYSEVSESEYSSLAAVPRYGHFFGEKTEVGISIGYDWNQIKYKNTSSFPTSNETSTGSFLAGPYVRLYQNLAERFYFNFSASATFYTGSGEANSSDQVNTSHTEYDTFQFQAGISPGLTYFFNNHWATNISVGVLNYESTKSTNKSTDVTTSTDGFDAGINIGGGLGFGIGFYF